MEELRNRIYQCAGDGITLRGESGKDCRCDGSDAAMELLLTAVDQWRNSISKRLTSLVRQLEERGGRESDWERLEHHVRDTFPELHSHMIRCAPPLTPMERKVFLLTGMNIAPADVATFLRCTRRTILRHRCSIRRKLHLLDGELSNQP